MEEADVLERAADPALDDGVQAACSVMSSPSKVIRPAVGLYTPVSMLKKVVFPAPFGPMSATIAPRG